MDIEFLVVDDSDIPALLDKAERILNNPRYERSQFEEYIGFGQKNDRFPTRWLGAFGENMAPSVLAVLQHIPSDVNAVFVSEIQAFIKGNGLKLLKHIDKTFRNKWLASAPHSALYAFYRNRLGWKEATIKHSKWHDGNSQHFFYNCLDKDVEDDVLARIDSFRTDI